MATDQSAPSTEELTVDEDEDPSRPPGIAHLTVVPENADSTA